MPNQQTSYGLATTEALRSNRAAEAMARLQEQNKPQFSQSDVDKIKSEQEAARAKRSAEIDAEVSRRAAEAGKGGGSDVKPDESAIRAQVESEIRRAEEEAERRRQAALAAQYGSQYEM